MSPRQPVVVYICPRPTKTLPFPSVVHVISRGSELVYVAQLKTDLNQDSLVQKSHTSVHIAINRGLPSQPAKLKAHMFLPFLTILPLVVVVHYTTQTNQGRRISILTFAIS